MTELHLYDISAEIASILSADEWTEETEDALEACQHSLEVKAGSIAELIRIAESQAAQCKEEEQRIASMRKAREKKAEWLRNYLLRNLEAVGRTEVAIGTRTIKVVNNPPALVVDNETLLPKSFFNIIPAKLELDNAMLKEALKAGPIDGARLVRGKRIELK